jgi:hypothetical protein
MTLSDHAITDALDDATTDLDRRAMSESWAVTPCRAVMRPIALRQSWE